MGEFETLYVPNSICWNITSKCNERCEFCYRDNISEDLEFDVNKKILDKIIASGVKKITFAGGEPLMYKGVLELIKYAKKNGVITSLTTNSILLSDELLLQLDGVLDWITLSLDAHNGELQTKMTRNKNHFDNVLRILDTINKNNLSMKIKINTIVSKINKDEVKHMIDIINKYNIYRWKLFQFIPLRGSAEINIDKFYISDDDFLKVKNEIMIKDDMTKNKIITFTDRNSLESSYFVIFPNGDVRISTDLKDTLVGNLIKDDIREIWKNTCFEKNSHHNRTIKTIDASTL
ncbi:MAG: radical SAM protein [Bacilli bacterium]|nr:radical SAM protein [Bacilli bacterium]